VQAQESANDCPVCGNLLASSDVACPRCKANPVAFSQADVGDVDDAPLPEATPKEMFPDRFYEKRAPVDSPYPSVPEPETSTAASSSRRGRNLKIAGSALVALTALIAGASYFFSGTEHVRQEAKFATAPLADSSLSEAPRPGVGASPAGTKNTSIDVMGTIDAVRSAMVRGELNTARQQLAILPPGEDQRPDVRRITDELVQREHARDSALGLARACEKAGDVPCVLRSAGDALASDTSDSEARGMLLRAVTQTGAAQFTAVKVNQRGDPSITTHRQAPEKRRIRRAPQMFANTIDIYGKH
jgi:hypothetical protein